MHVPVQLSERRTGYAHAQGPWSVSQEPACALALYLSPFSQPSVLDPLPKTPLLCSVTLDYMEGCSGEIPHLFQTEPFCSPPTGLELHTVSSVVSITPISQLQLFTIYSVSKVI